ncbi:hypothetical protein CDAR_450891 [Caerostris darwini]|uniref:Uncharacterized protein n=1 Tax=Caerostris darwini TaxID=1538125 RepID=A0AAV4VF15_9ARAC|nr:hypothetical protein CDAR_450891 [Caerostris darwini]
MAYIVQADYTFWDPTERSHANLVAETTSLKKCSSVESGRKRQTGALTAEREKRDLFILRIGSRHVWSAKQDTLPSPTLLPHPLPQRTPNSLDSQDSSSVNEMHCVIRAEWLTQTSPATLPLSSARTRCSELLCGISE